MDLIDKLTDITHRVNKMKHNVATEEATKNAFVMPFLSALGYDVFNPMEVIPEFTADIGTKKGEKVDYCILKEGKPAIIIECKHWEETLDIHKSQLHRYFHVTDSRFAILTNGILYRFFTDLDEANKMDSKPFFEFSLEKLNENIVNELKRFQNDNFNVDEIVNTANNLKYSIQIKELLAAELREPSEDFVKYLTWKVYEGKVTKKIYDQFALLVKVSVKQHLSELVNDRLKAALAKEELENKEMMEEISENEDSENTVVTTEEEIEAYRIVQAILRKVIPLERVHIRDTKSYCGVIMDNNNRKPICRLHFNGSKKYIGLFDEQKQEERILLEKLEDIYLFSEQLTNTTSFYDA